MSGNKNSSNYYAGYKKKRNKKRQASSPLSEHGNQSNVSTVNKGEQKSEQKGQSKKSKQECNVVGNTTQTVSSLSYQYRGPDRTISQNMAFQQPSPFGMSQPSFSTSPSSQYSGTGFGFQPPPQPPPPWASELLEEIKQIKSKMASIEKIEKTVNCINAKVSDLETKIKHLDNRVSETEKSCQFQSSENESNKKEIKSAKTDLKQLKDKCANLEKNTKTLNDNSAKVDSKLLDIETRSMRDNLMFYGIPEEGENENCEILVKKLFDNVLKIPQSENFLFDRVHRVGRKSGKPRPIVAKFHYYSERERVRQASFNYGEQLKAANMGVGAQLPKDIRDARKPLYSAMKKAKSDGKNVKFVGKKLLIEGEEYKEQPAMEQ